MIVLRVCLLKGALANKALSRLLVLKATQDDLYFPSYVHRRALNESSFQTTEHKKTLNTHISSLSRT